MKFKKRPVVIDAMQYDGTNADQVIVWANRLTLATGLSAANGWFHVRTLEGVMEITKDDWVIVGIKGELYPCKPVVFGLTYEQVGDNDMIEAVKTPEGSTVLTVITDGKRVEEYRKKFRAGIKEIGERYRNAFARMTDK